LIGGLQNSDGVDVTLRDILERPRVQPHAQQNRVAVESTLGLAAGLERVSHLLQLSPGNRERASRGGVLPELQQALAQVEVDQRRLVRAAAEARVGERPLPLDAS